MPVKLLVAILSCSCFISCTQAPEKAQAPNSDHFENATILSVLPRPPASGILSTWITFTVAAANETQTDIYMQYLGGNQEIPVTGQLCTFSVSKMMITGITVYERVPTDRRVFVTPSVQCASQ